jgi:uncharacterized protein YaaN involved in tellurite resistance
MSDIMTAPRPVDLALKQTIDLSNPTAVVLFGSGAQSKATEAANSLLAATKLRDAGAAGAVVNDMLLTLKGFNPKDEAEKGGILSAITSLWGGAKKDAVSKLQQFETVKDAVEDLKNRMEEQKDALLTDIDSIDGLYQSTLEWFHALADHIAAAEERLAEGEAEYAATKPQVEQSGDMLAAQRLADRRASLDELERRIHDLRLTRQVVMQALPSLRLIQDNDRALVGKIQSVVVNTVPLWIQQMAQAILIQRMTDTANTTKAASDLTNQLLTQNAEMLRQGNKTTREQIERGVFDVEAVVKANQTLIGTLNDSLAIAEKAKEERKKAKATLDKCEDEIKRTLQGMKQRAA